MWRHDAPGQTRTPGEPLESCIGSLDIIDLPPIPGRQMELDMPALDAPTADPVGTMVMF
ncbi:hypothetical protein [Actinacidiphila sp. ITFR-21]|uniref:hypothetical protein n=1 Tax=Actinacidiphila sp. ITFR-21 TaxID=3075199 RepID=UPI002889A458|nr:hypothetical protein [Streptomyces sp. ITFR-21]WNI20401.1 hypothetical protein RLT57_32885 [Streptomyces sp. ITFR-21]